MRRAFLSYSSDDAAYVHEVASLLGRPRASIDHWSFKPGEDFRDEIRGVLDEADISVFFISESSLRSSWCQFELDETDLRMVRKKLRRSLPILIDDVDIAELPEWLKRVKAVRHASPQRSARAIEALLLQPEHEPHPFIGRSSELQRALRKLTDADPLPRILIATGLEGIGRRTFLRHLAADGLDLDLGPLIVLPQTATIEDIYMAALSATMLLTKEEAERELDAFRRLTPEEQASEVAEKLASLTEHGSAPCIVDHGSMLDSSGRYLDLYQGLIQSILKHRNAYLALVHRRAPRIDDLPFRPEVLRVKLSPLEPPDSQALVMKLLREIGVTPQRDDAKRLADQVAGYPPTAYFVASRVEDYGLDVVLGRSDQAQDFHSQRFAQFIDELGLGQCEAEILSYLAQEISLPLEGIAAATGNSIAETARAIEQLVDANLAEVFDDEYMVAAPIQVTMFRGHGVALDREWYEQAYSRLEKEYWSDGKSLPPISVVDATLRAGLRTGRSRGRYGSLVRPSLLIDAAFERYHQRSYDEALEYIERAETLGGVTPTLLEIKIKALAQLGRVGDARQALRSYREFGERRQWYLDGFIDRRQRRYDKACDKFQKGYARNDRSLPLLRDYADSLLRVGAGEQALRIGGEARDHEPRDPFVLDLFARIAISVGTEREAEDALAALEAVDHEERFISLRRAWFLIRRRGTADAGRQAAKFAEKACKRRDAPFEAFVAWARALIIARNFTRYENHVRKLLERKSQDSKVVDYLDCEASLQQDDWRHAEKSLRRAHYPVDYTRSAELRILEQKSQDHTVLLTDRQTAEKELEHLRKAVEGHPTQSVDDLISTD